MNSHWCQLMLPRYHISNSIDMRNIGLFINSWNLATKERGEEEIEREGGRVRGREREWERGGREGGKRGLIITIPSSCLS